MLREGDRAELERLPRSATVRASAAQRARIVLLAAEPGDGQPASVSPRHSSTTLAGYWSRRITDEHRLVYKLVDDEIRIAACRYHYVRWPSDRGRPRALEGSDAHEPSYGVIGQPIRMQEPLGEILQALGRPTSSMIAPSMVLPVSWGRCTCSPRPSGGLPCPS
ncbi:MAG: type II toxin-antitoxin system YoeB family toxin [Propionibacteriaceae bacterium]